MIVFSSSHSLAINRYKFHCYTGIIDTRTHTQIYVRLIPTVSVSFHLHDFLSINNCRHIQWGVISFIRNVN